MFGCPAAVGPIRDRGRARNHPFASASMPQHVQIFLATARRNCSPHSGSNADHPDDATRAASCVSRLAPEGSQRFAVEKVASSVKDENVVWARVTVNVQSASVRPRPLPQLQP